MKQVLTWSNAVNASVEDIVRNVPPFPLVGESLEKISQWADIIVCSGTPGDALAREWREHSNRRLPEGDCWAGNGQERKNTWHWSPEKYPEGHVLMIGDAPGDMKAAKANSVLFYPDQSPVARKIRGERFHNEIADMFHNGGYTGAVEAGLIDDFNKLLPDSPPWAYHEEEKPG